ncbi:hypothetical protein Tco_0327932 [Tanacetum coccineum]
MNRLCVLPPLLLHASLLYTLQDRIGPIPSPLDSIHDRSRDALLMLMAQRSICKNLTGPLTYVHKPICQILDGMWKTTYDSLRLSQAQILWGMYNKKKVDYAYLLWEDFIYQIENKNTKKGNAMYYPRFTKLVVNFVMNKDPSVLEEETRHSVVRVYPALTLTNEDIRQLDHTKVYYAFASDKPHTVPPKKEERILNRKAKAKELETISEENLHRLATQITLKRGVMMKMMMYMKMDENRHNDEEQSESEDDGDDFIQPKLTTHDDEIIQREEMYEMLPSILIVHTPLVFPHLMTDDSDSEVEEMDVEETRVENTILIVKMDANNSIITGPTFELMKGTCKSLTKLEYFCEEVYKATQMKLDLFTPKAAISHDLEKPLYRSVPNSQAEVIPFSTKTKAADYRHIKWIEDLVPNSMWSQVIVHYDKFALWGVSHWDKKRRQFYAFAITRESARDVYSKRRIIAVTKFSDGTHDDVRTALMIDSRVIQWSICLRDFFRAKVDKANARAMIQAIDKRLKIRRIMRSLERFVGGRPYRGVESFEEVLGLYGGDGQYPSKGDDWFKLSIDDEDNEVGKVKVLRVFEMIEHDGRACIYGDFVSVNTNDILTNDEFPILDVGRKIISEDNGGI